MPVRVRTLVAVAVVAAISMAIFVQDPPLVSRVPDFELSPVVAGDLSAGGIDSQSARADPLDESTIKTANNPSSVEQDQLRRVFLLRSAAESGDIESFLELDALLKLCAIATPTSAVAPRPPPEQSPMRGSWLAKLEEIRSTCRPLRLEQVDMNQWWALGERLREAAWPAGELRLGMPGPVPSLNSGRADDLDRMTDSWNRAASAQSPPALEAALRGAIPGQTETALPYLREALEQVGVQPTDPVLQYLSSLGPPLAACRRFGQCQLSPDWHARLCIYLHACFGNLPLPELLNGRIMSSADYYKLQAIVAALLAQLDRPGG